MNRLCVFAGSSVGVRPAFREAAAALGRTLAARGLGVVYGGGRVGLMGVLADAALAAGGEVIGVIPQALATKEIAHQGLAELRVVGSMHERKALMSSLADGFVALPGGLGTLDELFEITTWAQLGLHGKPIGLLDVDGFFAPLAALLDHVVAAGFVREEHRRLVVHAPDTDALLERMRAYEPVPSVMKWIGLDET